MTPIGKIVKVLLALTVAAAVAAGLAGCKQEVKAPPPPESPSAPQQMAPKAEAQDAKPQDANAPRQLEIKVTENGYEPSPVTLTKGQPVELKITRTTENTCATEFILDEAGINQKLPLNETVAVKFTPEKTGELVYGCGMGKMISGRFQVQ